MSIEHYKSIFDQYGGMMRTKELQDEKIYYQKLQQLIQEGHIEKVRYGYYQWIDSDDFSEVGTIIRLFPDAILCMDTATARLWNGIWLSAKIPAKHDSI